MSYSDDPMGTFMSKLLTGKNIFRGIIGLLILIIAIALPNGMMGKNKNENYQVLEHLNGKVAIRDRAGIYPRYFARIVDNPKAVQAYYSADPGEGGTSDDSITCTFNDAGKGTVSTIVRFRMPTDDENRKLVHREFTANIDNVKASVRAHLVNCIKVSATMMTSSENQTSRKAEFAKIIGDQLKEGLYRFKRVEVALLDISGQPKLNDQGQALTTFATAVVRDENDMPIVDEASPLKQYGIVVAQFSITGIKYDPQTLAQFAKKKEASLLAELAKIQVEQAKQETQTKIEEGKRMKAEKDAEMSVQIAQAKGEAEMLVTRANQAKLQAAEVKEKAVIEAQQKQEVAVIDANQKQQVAVIELAAAKLDSEAKIVLAEAKQQEIDLAGFITERERVLAEIKRDRDIGVAKELKGLQLPDKVIMTGGGGSGGDGANQLFSVLGVNQTLDLMEKLSKDDLVGPKVAAVQ